MVEKTSRKAIDWHQFFITVIGTAIGVALTFVVSGMLEHRKKEQARRLTAIMVIHDIDNTINVLKDLKGREEQEGELLRSALKQRDQLEEMPSDTLNKVLNILADSQSDFSFDTSKEKIFNSDLDTWQNLGNMAFLDNAQSFYHFRQGFQDGLNQSTMWKKPIPDNEFMNFIMGTGWVTPEEYTAALRPFLKEKLYEKQVVYYINVSSSRVNYLTQVIDYGTGLNDENKFLMGITDRELDDYVNNISKKGVPPTRSKLMGHWVFNNGEKTAEYNFLGGHDYIYVNDYTSSFYKSIHWSGRLKMRVSYRGAWVFRGDSLVLTPDYNTADVSVDPSALVPEENMQDSLNTWVNDYRERTLDYFKGLVGKGEHYSVKARMDSSKDKMEWTDSDGSARYLKRKVE